MASTIAWQRVNIPTLKCEILSKICIDPGTDDRIRMEILIK
jgi:hypothetical protein